MDPAASSHRSAACYLALGVLLTAGCGATSTSTPAGRPARSPTRTAPAQLPHAPRSIRPAPTHRVIHHDYLVRNSRRVRSPVLLELAAPNSDGSAWIRTDKPLGVNRQIVPFYLAVLDADGNEITRGAITRQHHYRSTPPCYDIDFVAPEDLAQVHRGRRIRVALFNVNHHGQPTRISPPVSTTAHAAPRHGTRALMG